MIKIIHIQNRGITPLEQPGLPPQPAQPPWDTEHAYRPAPQPGGALLVDPEIHLPSPGMNVDIAHFYNNVSTYNGPYGYGRTLSRNLI